MQHADIGRGAQPGEGRKPALGVGRVPAQEVVGPLDRPADAVMLVALVWPPHRLAGGVEGVVGHQPGRAGCPRGDDREHLGHGRFWQRPGESLHLGQRGRGQPLPQVGVGGAWIGGQRQCALQLGRDHGQGMVAGLCPHHQAVEGGDVAAHCVDAEHVGLDQGGARSGKGVVDQRPRPERAPQQRLGQLGRELAQVGVQPVHVLGALPLGKLRLRPGQLIVDPRVQRGLGDPGHRASVAAAADASGPFVRTSGVAV